MDAGTRFKILNLDNFTCQYCGRSSPEVKLEVDHVVPISKGGNANPNNLVTACRECNKGKADMRVNIPADRFEAQLDQYDCEINDILNYYSHTKHAPSWVLDEIKHKKAEKFKYIIDYLENHNGNFTKYDLTWKRENESIEDFKTRYLHDILIKFQCESNFLTKLRIERYKQLLEDEEHKLRDLEFIEQTS